MCMLISLAWNLILPVSSITHVNDKSDPIVFNALILELEITLDQEEMAISLDCLVLTDSFLPTISMVTAFSIQYKDLDIFWGFFEFALV